VLGIEKFDIVHENGSHTGQSRLIRKAYFEHPAYVPLLQKAYDGWENLEKRSNSRLFYKTGILYSGKADDFLISGSRKSARAHNLELNEVTAGNQSESYPQFSLPSHYSTIFEPDAGFITPERAILTYINEALKLGAEVRSGETVIDWQESSNGVEVRTDQGHYNANCLIITAGAWTSQLVTGLKPKLKVTKQAIFWVNVNNSDQYLLNKMPCWGINQEELTGLLYGFPILNEHEFGGPGGLKIGYHNPGEPINPEHKTAAVRQSDKDLIVSFMEEFMPGAFKSFNEEKTCLYTYSPDEHFIIDFMPDQRHVIFATGFSGHGFKFIPVVGEILADLATNGATDLPIEFLRLR